jgi:putative endonuclease
MEKLYHVYILSSRSRVLYTGVTNDLIGRMAKHRDGSASNFTAKYRVHRLVYQESFRDVRSAIAREKQIKSWTREKRVALVQETNPTWIDLAADWFAPYPRKAGPSASLGMTSFKSVPNKKAASSAPLGMTNVKSVLDKKVGRSASLGMTNFQPVPDEKSATEHAKVAVAARLKPKERAAVAGTAKAVP